MDKNENCIKTIALNDIFESDAKDRSLSYKKNNSYHSEIWNTSKKDLRTKENASLNKELGIHSVNYLGNKNGCTR